MDWLKSIISVIVGIAAVLIVWRVGFYPQPPEQPEKPAVTKVVAEAEKTDEIPKPDAEVKPEKETEVSKTEKPEEIQEPVQPADPNKPAPKVVAAGDSGKSDDVRDQIRTAVITEKKELPEPNEPMENLNLKNVEMKTIVEKLAKWTGKVIIPTDESLKQKITIYSPDKLPRSKALQKIYSALRMKGYIAEQTDGTIYLKEITQAKLGEVPTISEDYPLAMIENKDQVVQKFFKLNNYSPSQMGQIILPLVGDYGYVSVDENTGTLFVIDTVKSLMRIGNIIKQFDVVEVEEIKTEIFEIKHGDPTKIVELLQTLLGDGSGSGGSGRRGSASMPPGATGKSSGGTAQTVTVGTSRTPALLIPQTDYNWIIAKATEEDLKKIRDWIDKLDKEVPTLYVDQPLDKIDNKNQIVQKFFKLNNYSPSQMSQIIGPLLSETGYISADESTGNLVVRDTVEKLMQVDMIIKEFDVPEAETTVTDYFEIHNSDPSEIVQLLRMLISGETGASPSSRSSYGRSSYGRSSYNRGYSQRGYSSGYRGGSRSGPTTPVLIGPSEQPIVLVPMPQRKLIIARASAEDMKLIADWIERLDHEEPVKAEYETVQIVYANVSEVADRLNETMQQMPGSELQASVLIQPMEQARQIVIFGREDMRTMVKKLISEIDIPAGLFKTDHFKLKHADPDEIKEKIEELYSVSQIGSGSRYTYVFNYGSSRGSSMSADTVKVISYPTLKQVTVIASAENMEKVRKQIAEWDTPIDVEQVKPLIIELQNSDPVQMAELLRKLFSEESSSGFNIYDYIFGGDTEEKAKIVGPLYGQLTFEEVPQTKKIIVISKIPEAYQVIKELILDLDRQEMGEIPKVIELKYADPEDLSERLNVMFLEAGQTARIRLTETGLSESSSMDKDTDSSSPSSSNSNNTSSENTTYTPPWSGAGSRGRTDNEMPISNVIGRIRFVPEPHTKSIMVLSPPEFMDEIEKLISQLDVPGKQVMMEAIIVEIEHSKATSLGIEVATNPAAFGSIGENAILALSNLTTIGTHGSAAGKISSAAGIAATGTGSVLSIGTDVYALIDFLVKTTDAKILNQQTLWTKDNEEAKFFKGSEVAFLGGTTLIGGQGGSQQDVEFDKVGMELRARPSITPENKVDMIVNVKISSLTTDLVNSQPVRSNMETRTNMIIHDNQTLLLGGILFQKDSNTLKKVPLFGDLPLVGGMFRHNNLEQTNSELLVFITPHVIDESTENIPEETKKKIEQPMEKLKEIKEQLEKTAEELAWEKP
ncbi:MAG: hypothetical protein JW837_16145 [Sedimentisphaerales bacterium]|nr:hypothetical protein [Sedimentisphaerales bacterium]